MLNTIIGIMGTIATVGLFGCLWKWLLIKIQQMKQEIELTRYKKICKIILYFSLSCLGLFILAIVLWFALIYPNLH